MSLRKTKDQEVEVLKRGLISFWGAPKLPSPKIKELRVALGLITGLEKYNGQLAVENMRVESKAFIDGAAKEIFDGERFWIVSIHDALACDLENVEKVRGLLVKHITEGTGFEPVLKQEILEVDEPVSPSDGGLDVREVSMQLKGHQDCQERLQEAVSA